MTILRQPAKRLVCFTATCAFALALAACGERQSPLKEAPPAPPVVAPTSVQPSATKVPDTSTPAASGETAPSSGMLGRSETAVPVPGSGAPPTPPAKPEKSPIK